ncbi:SAM-dependent chlorinase/fluorinase [Niabella pedocola]|uniref:SAM-dependent chlorinase/fluorinase n=1 Tax=Niabella pedocola TaxID=1752077 RepID=A0ABS8PKA8_9BACT|nr:SAM-dependent chlorinase/fluorinase [Niabella pedocola]MCD2421533.1 SAM-dependent chlorinase/fluorinase [Niabella pedocola]
MNFVTLTSDIGYQDYLVGAIKAQLLQVNADLQLVDISHNITPFNFPQASYVCRGAFKNFPEFTFHLILVNLFGTRPENLLVAFHKNQYIICADNGLLSMILEEKPDIIIGIPLSRSAIKNTLYVTEVMAKTVERLVNGEPIQKIGVPDFNFREKNPLQPLVDSNYIEGQIIFIDNFENVIVNITREQFEEQRNGRGFKIVFKRDEVIDRISESYADVREGDKLALFNSAGYLEIAINKGNAAGLFGLKGFSDKASQSSNIMQNQLLYQTVRIYFE